MNRLASRACSVRSYSGVSVTVDSPEKQRVGTIAQYHGAVDQAWSPAEVAAAVVFELTPTGCDLSTDTPPYERTHSLLALLRVEASVKQTIEVAVIAIGDKTRSQPLPRGPSLVRAPWH